MDPLSITASAIALYGLAEEIAKLCISFTSEAKHAPREMRQFADEISQFQRSMLQLRFMLAETDDDRTKPHNQQFLENIIGSDSSGLDDCQKELDELHSRLKKLLGTSGLARLKAKLSWPLNSDEAVRIVNRMRSIRDSVTNAAALDTYDLLRDVSSRQQIAEKTNEVRQKKQDAEAEDHKKAEELRRARKALLDWLRHPDPSENHNIACAARNERIKSGSWLFESKSFHKFQSESKSLLWLYGNAGCGKSVLSATVIEHLQGLARADSSIRVAYWYFNANDKQRMSAENLWRAVIVQFISQSPNEIPLAVQEMWQTRGMGSEAPKQADLNVMLRKLVASDLSLKYYIVIDAFDESNSDSSERETCLQAIEQLLSKSPSPIRVYLTSRPHEDIRKQLNDFIQESRIDLEAQPDQDISNHIVDQLKNDRILNRWPKKQQKTIKETLIERAAGMFRWVDLQLQALRKCKRPADLDRTLNLLPKDLFEQYRLELQKIDDIDAEDALRLLQWLAFPQRKLRLDEAVEMLAVTFDTDPPHFEEERRIFDPRQVLEICGSLVRIDTTKKGRDHRGAVAKVESLTTAHSTVIDFLKSKTVQVGSLPECEFKSAPISLRMAETCLAYLLDLAKKEPDLTEEQLEDYPFARYCAEFWDDQYRQAQTEDTLDFTRVNRMALDLFHNKKANLMYVRLCDPDFEEYTVDFEMDESDLCTPLYYTALHGLLGMIKDLLADGADLETDNPGYYGTALCASAGNGRVEAVQTLIAAGANPLHASYRKGYAIAVAVENDHKEVVELLLKQSGIDINCRRMPPDMIEKRKKELAARPPSTVPEKDSDASSESVISSISMSSSSQNDDSSSKESGSGSGSSSNSNSTSENDSGSSEDSSTSSSNDGSDTDADSDSDSVAGSGDSSGSTYFTNSKDEALAASQGLVYIAASYGSNKTLQFLLENGADPNIEGGALHTALIAACQAGSQSTVETLMTFGAQIDLYGGTYGTALQAACENSDMLPTVKRLITAGIDINYRSPSGQTALYRACSYGELEYVEVLLDAGAKVDIDPENSSPLVPLVAAACGGQIEIVRRLLAAGADLTRQDMEDGCALCAAGFMDHVDVLRLLLQHSANPNESGCVKYDNCLFSAAASGSLESMKVLIDNGADVTAQHGTFGTVLQAAVKSWDTSVLNYLVEKGASPTTRGGLYGLPLFRACREDYGEMVTCLLDHGADPNSVVEDDMNNIAYGGTALRYCRSEMIVNLVVARGADINENIGLLGTPLTFAARKGSLKALQALISADARLEEVDKLRQMTALLHAAERGDMKMGTYLLGKGASIKAEDRIGRNAVNLAITGGHVSVLEQLQKLKIKPNHKDIRGVLSLHYAACSRAFLEMETHLSHIKADLKSLDPQGWSALHWAVQCHPESAGTVRRLLELGADKDLKDNYGRTPMDLALNFKAMEVQAILSTDISTSSAKAEDVAKPAMVGEHAVAEHKCDICNGTRRLHYRCKTCIIFELCSRCLEDKDMIHDTGHDFEQLQDLRPDQPINQDPSIPDIPQEDVASLEKSDYSKPAARNG